MVKCTSCQFPVQRQNWVYGNALDSVISIIKENKALRVIYVGGRECVRSYLPDTLQGIAVKWMPPAKSKKEKLNLKNDEMLVVISCLSIIRDAVIVVIYTPRQGDQVYKFQYYYQPATMDYKLQKVEGPSERTWNREREFSVRYSQRARIKFRTQLNCID